MLINKKNIGNSFYWNNSFSIKESLEGEVSTQNGNVVYDKNYISATGSILDSRESVFLNIRSNPDTLNPEIVKFTEKGNLKLESESKNYFNYIFNTSSPSLSPINTDIVFLLDSGFNSGLGFNVHLDSFSNSIKVSNGFLNETPITENGNRSYLIDVERGGQGILGISSSASEDSIENLVLEVKDEILPNTINRNEDGSWESLGSLDVFYPLALIDFDRGSVVKLNKSNELDFSISNSVYGINEKSGGNYS